MGELSSARQALEGASLAPGSEDTLQALRDLGKHPQDPELHFRDTCPTQNLGRSSVWTGTVFHAISAG